MKHPLLAAALLALALSACSKKEDVVTPPAAPVAAPAPAPAPAPTVTPTPAPDSSAQPATTPAAANTDTTAAPGSEKK